MNKTIWMAWFQGENDPSIPNLNKHCIQEWRRLNPDWDINVLTNDNIIEYVPEYFEIISKGIDRPYVHRSEVLRVLLLSKFGGVWVDASVFPVQGLSSFYDQIVNDTGFFTYRFFPRKLSPNGGYAETVSWFMCADYPKHPLIEKLKPAYFKRYHYDTDWQYLTFHDTLSNLYDTDPEINYIINNMVQIDAKIPISSLNKTWKLRSESFLYKRPWNENIYDAREI